MASVHQEFQTIATVLSYALGGKKSQDKEIKENTPQNLDDAKRKLAAVFAKR